MTYPYVSMGFTNVTMIPLGGADTIGRSCYLYVFRRAGGGRFTVMVDAGIEPGSTMLPETYERDLLPAFEVASSRGIQVNCILVTHAHADHAAALVYAAQRWPKAPIIVSHETAMFIPLQIGAGLRQLKESRDPKKTFDVWKRGFPYDERDLSRVCENVRILTEPSMVLADGLELRHHHAGHIRGAVMFEFVITMEGGETKSILHTGDLSIYEQLLVSAAEIPHLPGSVLVCEATNLGVDHDRDAEKRRLTESIASVCESGGKALLPVFALNRGQELTEFIVTNPELASYPLYLYGPSFSDFTECYREIMPDRAFGKVLVHGERGGKRDWRNHVKATYRRDEPAIILASGGMGNGAAGACTEAMLGWGYPNDAYFNTGYIVPGTKSDEVHKAAQARTENPRERFVMFGEGARARTYEVTCKVDRFHLSGHPYDAELKRIWDTVDPSMIVLVHGDTINEYIAEYPSHNGASLIPTAVGEEIALV